VAPEFAVPGPGIFPCRDIATTSPAISNINFSAFPRVELEQTIGTDLASANKASPNPLPGKSELWKTIASAPLPAPAPENGTKSASLQRVLVVDGNLINLDLMMKFMRKRQPQRKTASSQSRP
jgi:hypothetical protein